MGNVASAAAGGVPQPPRGPPPASSGVTLPPAPPMTAPAPESEQKPVAATTPEKSNGNPGSYEELYKKCKDVFPTPYEGFKLVVNKGLSNHFQISHTLNLSASTPSSYHFGATYVGDGQVSPAEAYPVILGDIDNAGSMSAQIIHQFFPNSKSKLVIQTQKTQFSMIQADTEYRGKDFTATMTLGNIDVLNESGIVVAHYLQRLLPKIDVGAELLYHYGAGQEAAALSLAARYTGDRWIAAGTVGQSGWHAAYYHRGNENIQVGVEYEYNSRAQEGCVSLGYQVDLPKANFTFRGLVDTNWTVAGFLEKKLPPLPFTFVLSGMINHQKSQSRFGFGLLIG
eukprot:gene11233-12412_t